MDSLREIKELFYDADIEALENQLQNSKRISKQRLLNFLNYINFQDGTITLNFRHKKYNNIISICVKPQPCKGDRLECHWVDSSKFIQQLVTYDFVNFVISDGHKIILVKADLKEVKDEGISFGLPDTSYEIVPRQAKRHLCKNINVEFIQNGIVFYGTLLDFSAISFRVELSIEPPQSFHWINPEYAIYVILRNEHGVIYSGECKLIKQNYGQKARIFILELQNNHICRFRPKQCRSIRHKLSPSPNIIFEHPFTKKLVTLQVEELSGSGFSVNEYYENSVLFAGMIIPEVYIEFATDFRVRCKAQVVNRQVSMAEDEILVRCGVAILDMDMQDQVKLSSILHKVTNEKAYVCNTVDMDDLWKFFFEAGFVYPEKYIGLYIHKEKFKDTYEKLYNNNPHIARHFIYQDKGVIQGHISMLRVYENTWLFHHHAAKGNNRAGLIVLDQIGRYVNDFYRLYSTHMDFIICYFRPENRFPNRVFGNFARQLNDPKGTSIDAFAYFYFPKDFEAWDLPGVTITKSQPEDIIELESHYEYESGGLALNALNLEPDLIDSEILSKTYQEMGFSLERKIFSLKREGIVKAIIMLNVSDIGLNLSNLTNCIHVFVLDPELPRNFLISALSKVSKYYADHKIPVLLYPVSYAEKQFIQFEKIYNLWVISPHYTDKFLEYTSALGKYHETIKHG